MSNLHATNGAHEGVVERAVQSLAHFHTLKTNLKKGGTFQLAKKTAVIGENKSGKSSIREAIELAMTGKHPRGHHLKDMLALAPEGADELFAELEGASGKMTYRAAHGVEPHSCPLAGSPLAALGEDDKYRMLPALSMRELFTLSSTKARSALFKRFGQVEALPKPVLTEEQQSLWTDAVSAIEAKAKEKKQTLDVGDLLAALESWFKAEKMATGKKRGVLEREVEAIRKNAGESIAGTELIPQLEGAYRKALDWERTSPFRGQLKGKEVRLADLRAARAELLAAAERLAEEEIEAKTKDARAAEQLKAIEESIADREAELRAAEKSLVFGERLLEVLSDAVSLVQNDEETIECSMCFANTLRPRHSLAHYEPRVTNKRDERDSTLRALESARAALEEVKSTTLNAYGAIMQRRSQIDAEYASKGNEIQSIEADIEKLKAGLEGVPDSYVGKTSTMIDEELKRLREGSTHRVTIQNKEKEIEALQKRGNTAKALENKTARVLQDLLQKTKTTAEACVNRYMPRGFKAELSLDGSNVVWQVIGGDGRPHVEHEICGSEESALVVALALAWTEGAPLRTLLLDDRDLYPFSKKNTRRILELLGQAVDQNFITQLIVFSTRPDEIPNGFLVIDRGGWDAEDDEPGLVFDTTLPVMPPRPAPAPVAEDTVSIEAPAADAPPSNGVVETDVSNLI
jgi:hypothetical protein